MTQAPTPGPLTKPVKGAANGLCNRSACQAPLAGEPTHQFMDGNFTGGPRLHYCEKCAKEFDKWDAIDMKDGEPRRIQREPKSLAPTAPVEAGGSERGQAGAVMDALWPLLGGNHTSAELWTEIDTAVSEALRPQPSGETGEALDRLKMAAHVYEDDEMAADCATLEALLSARPLALGGQQGVQERCQRCGGEVQGWLCQSCPAEFRENDDGHLVFDEDTTPARAEASGQ